MLAAAELVWLLAAVAKGDEAAFERLYRATQATLYGVTLRILRRRDLAEEVLQETYVHIWRAAGEYNPRIAPPLTWMVAIARSGALDVVRKRTDRAATDTAPEVEDEGRGPLAPGQMTEALQRLLACMGRLDEEHRRTLLLAYYNGWSREQLAEKFDKPVNTIKARLRRSLIQIRECLAR
jgi:RNA polymerase sigma-70 factor (ECF subfamily)